jgi:hypothetical protein
MDILERIVEAVAQKLISMRLNEEDSMDTPKGDLIRRVHADRKFKKAIGKNTRRSTLGDDKSQGSSDYKARMSAGKKNAPTPIEKINQMGMKSDAERKARDAKADAIGRGAMNSIRKMK